MKKCEELINNLLSSIFEWYDEYIEASGTGTSELFTEIGKQALPC